VTTYYLDKFDIVPAEERLPHFLSEQLQGDDMRMYELAKACGYTRSNIIGMWCTGRTKVPIRFIPRIAHFLGFDVAQVLPLWIAGYADGEDQDVLWAASKRMLTAWEMGVIHTARDVYLGDDADE
jgi:hypothetical protein